MKKVSKEDSDLFRSAIRHVKSLHSKEKNIYQLTKKPAFSLHTDTGQVCRDRSRPVPTVNKADRFSRKSSDIKILDNIGEPAVMAEQSLFFARSGLQSRVIKKLKRGQFPIEATLDLHGLTVDQARTVFCEFMNQVETVGFQCIKIIHGKSRLKTDKPKIKNHVNQWIRQYSSVLAFTSAQPKDGGTGAIYILLKVGTGPPLCPYDFGKKRINKIGTNKIDIQINSCPQIAPGQAH